MKEEEKTQIYISYCEQASAITDKRHMMSSLYLTICSALTGVIVANHNNSIGVVLSFVGIIVSLIWFFMLQSYRKLNSAKFEVIEDIEKEMQMQLYSKEWSILKKKKYLRLTTLEICTSLIFVFLFLVLIVFILAKCSLKFEILIRFFPYIH